MLSLFSVNIHEKIVLVTKTIYTPIKLIYEDIKSYKNQLRSFKTPTVLKHQLAQ